MLQYTQTDLTTPSNAIELTGADLVQINGGGVVGGGVAGGGMVGGGFGGWNGGWGSGWGNSWGCGCWPPTWGWGGGFGGFGGLNSIIINVNSFNRRRR